MGALASLFVVALQVGAAEASEVSPHGFFAVPGAEDVSRTPGPGHSVRYFVDDPFPAKRTIDSIAATLGRHGWKASESAPDESSLEWEEFPDRRGGLVRLWSAGWVNAAGDEVTYNLSYTRSLTYSSESEQVSSALEPVYLSVRAWFDTRESAERARRSLAEQAAALQRALQPLVAKSRPCPTE